MSADNNNTSVWYKEPWPLIMIAIIVATICWCGISLRKVIQQRDFPIVTNYYADGQEVNQNLQKINNAITKQITASMVIDDLLQEVHITLTGNIETWPQTLTLNLTSNIHIDYDISCKLHKVDTATDSNLTAKYSGQLTKIMPGIYTIVLQNSNSGNNSIDWKLYTKDKLDTGITLNF